MNSEMSLLLWLFFVFYPLEEEIHYCFRYILFCILNIDRRFFFFVILYHRDLDHLSSHRYILNPLLQIFASYILKEQEIFFLHTEQALCTFSQYHYTVFSRYHYNYYRFELLSNYLFLSRFEELHLFFQIYLSHQDDGVSQNLAW